MRHAVSLTTPLWFGALAVASTGLAASVARASDDVRTPALPPASAMSPAAGEVSAAAPRWTARKSLVAVELSDAAGRPAVEVIDLASKRRLQVLGWGPVLSPDGRRVAVRRGPREAARLVIVDLATGDELALPGFVPPGEPSRFSPDGGRLLTTLALPGAPAAEVFLLDVRSEEPRLQQLTTGGGSGPRWLSDGELIYEVPASRGGTELILRDEGGLGQARRFWTDEPYQGLPDPATVS